MLLDACDGVGCSAIGPVICMSLQQWEMKGLRTNTLLVPQTRPVCRGFCKLRVSAFSVQLKRPFEDGYLVE